MRAPQEAKEFGSGRVAARTLGLEVSGTLLVFGCRIYNVCRREMELGERIPLEVGGVMGRDMFDKLGDGTVCVLCLWVYASESTENGGMDQRTQSVKVNTVRT